MTEQKRGEYKPLEIKGISTDSYPQVVRIACPGGCEGEIHIPSKYFVLSGVASSVPGIQGVDLNCRCPVCRRDVDVRPVISAVGRVVEVPCG